MLTVIREVLAEKDRQPVVSVSPVTPVRQVARLMSERKIGAILVIQQGRVIGVFTERDLMGRVIAKSLDPATTAVSQVMTPDPLSIGPDTTVQEALALMNDYRLRHLPVVEGEALVGIVSARDLTRSVVRKQREQIESINRAAKALARHPFFRGATPLRGV
jgi:CBS domain-containing protein